MTKKASLTVTSNRVSIKLRTGLSDVEEERIKDFFIVVATELEDFPHALRVFSLVKITYLLGIRKGKFVKSFEYMNKEILKVLVGSQAHGLATPDSDFDFRGVFVTPTSEILKLGGKVYQTNWIEGEVDDTSWELSHFLQMAVKSNPTILEVFLAPLVITHKENNRPEYIGPGNIFTEKFPLVWSSKGVHDAFIGYAHNQRKKFLDNKDNRNNKFAAAAARVLYNAYELLTTGTFTLRIIDTEVGQIVKRFKNGEYEHGEVMQHLHTWEQKVHDAFDNTPHHETDLDAVNEFLLKVRRENW